MLRQTPLRVADTKQLCTLKARDITSTKGTYLVVGEAGLQDGEEAVHVLDELLAGGVGEGTHSQQRLLVHRGATARKHPQQHLRIRDSAVHPQFGRLTWENMVCE